MKRLAAAIVILILLFNLVGYRIVAHYLQNKYDTQLEARLDLNQYDESQLIELKIPLNVAYQANQADYVRYYGEVILNEVTYKYVMRKILNDTLYLKCIPNTMKMQIEIAKNDFFENNNDLAQDNTTKKSEQSKSVSLMKLITEYNEHSFFLFSHINSSLQGNFTLPPVPKTTSTSHISPEQPPDFNS